MTLNFQQHVGADRCAESRALQQDAHVHPLDHDSVRNRAMNNEHPHVAGRLAVAIFGLTTTGAASANVFTAAPKAPPRPPPAPRPSRPRTRSTSARCSSTPRAPTTRTTRSRSPPGRPSTSATRTTGPTTARTTSSSASPAGPTAPQPTSCVQTAAPDRRLPILPGPAAAVGRPRARAGPATARSTRAGTYTFYCSAHNYMTGTVVVAAARRTTRRRSPPRATRPAT